MEQRECCCKHKETPRSQELQADLHKRLNRAIGQLNGIKTMIDDNRYCGDVLGSRFVLLVNKSDSVGCFGNQLFVLLTRSV